MRKIAVLLSCLLALAVSLVVAPNTALAAPPSQGSRSFQKSIAPKSVSQASATAAEIHCVAKQNGGKDLCFSTLNQAIQRADAIGLAVATLYDWILYNSAGPTVTLSVTNDCSRSTANMDYAFTRLDHMGWATGLASVNTRFDNGTHCDVFFHTDIDLVGDCAGNRWIDQYGHLGHYGCYKRASSLRLS